jgi:hypothetical protein
VPPLPKAIKIYLTVLNHYVLHPRTLQQLRHTLRKAAHITLVQFSCFNNLLFSTISVAVGGLSKNQEFLSSVEVITKQE